MRRERQHVKRRWSFVGSVKAIVNKVKPSTGDRHHNSFKGITLTTGTHIDLTDNAKRTQSLYRRSSSENQHSHNAVTVSKSVPHTSHSFNHLLSSKQRHGLTREELDEDVRRIVTHSDQKATALKVLKSRLLGDSGHSTGSGAEQTDSDVYLSDDPRNSQPRTLSQQNKPANSKIATSLRRAATSSRDYAKNDKNKKKQMLKSELFDQADGKKRFMLAATDNSGSILDKYIANARESAWVMGKKSAQQAKYEQETKESETEESYTASDWSEDTSSCTDESADYSTSGWSSNNSESEEVSDSSSESSADMVSSDDHELTPLQSHKNNLKSSTSTDSKLDRKAQQSKELERVPTKPSEIKKQNKLPSKEQTLSNSMLQPTTSSSSTTNRLRPKTPPRRRAPSSHQQKKCSIDEDLDEDDTNKVLALGDLIVQKAVEMNIDIDLEQKEEEIHETEELITEYEEEEEEEEGEEEVIEELVTASEDEELIITQDENLKLGDAISSHHSSCSHETSDDEVLEEQTLDTGSGISHEEYREDLMIRPELETIIEEEEENNNSPHPRKNRRKDRKSSYEGAVTHTGNGQIFCSPRFQSRTASFGNLSPKSASTLMGPNGSSFLGIPQDVKVNQARQRLHMQLGGCSKPCIRLPTADDVVTKPQDQDLHVSKPRPITPPDLQKLHASPTLDRVNSYQQAAAGISKPVVIPDNLSGKQVNTTKQFLDDTKTVVQVIEVEETTVTRRKKKKETSLKKSGKAKKGKKQKMHEDALEPEQEFHSERIGTPQEMYEEGNELTTQEESHISPKKEKKRIEREQKKRKKLMELIGEEAAKKVLSEDAEVIVVDKQGRRECIQSIKENPIAKVQANHKKASKSSSKPLKGSKTSSSSSTSSSSRFIPTAGGEMLTTKSSSANTSSSKNTDRSPPSSYPPSTSSPEHDDDGWRRESHESSSGVSTMNSDQALTPERNNSLDEHNDSGLSSTPSKSDRSRKPRDRTSELVSNNNVRAATTTIQAAAQLSALDSVNAILNAKKKDKKSKKSNKSSSSSGKQIPMRV